MGAHRARRPGAPGRGHPDAAHRRGEGGGGDRGPPRRPDHRLRQRLRPPGPAAGCRARRRRGRHPHLPLARPVLRRPQRRVPQPARRRAAPAAGARRRRRGVDPGDGRGRGGRMRTVRVSVSTAARPGPGARGGADPSGGWRPHVWIGAPAPGGLALPPAHPTMAWLYAPRGVYLDDRYLVVADSGNHRVLIWHGVPERDGAPADVVLGQPDGESEGPAAGGRGPEHGMHLPTGVLVHDGRLVVADAWHHRVLVWDRVPEDSGRPPDLVLGQPDPSAAEPNRGGDCSAVTMYWPYGVAVAGGRVYVADTGHRRVLGRAGGT